MIGSSKSPGNGRSRGRSRDQGGGRGADREADHGVSRGREADEPDRAPAQQSNGRDDDRAGDEARGNGKRRPDGRAERGAERGAPRDQSGPPARPANGRRLSGSAAVELAKEHLMGLTGQPCESVSTLNRTRDGWRVVLEIVELERIPRTTDIMASYLVELDEDGELMTYQRVGRYYRNEVSGES